MDINRYVTGVHLNTKGMTVTLKDGTEHLIADDNVFSTLALNEHIKRNFKQPETKTFEGWLGGDYEKLGFYDTQKDADRGHLGGVYLTELLEEFKGKKVSIKITEID